MAKEKLLKIKLETLELVGVYLGSSSTSVHLHRSRHLAVFVYKAKESRALILAIFHPTCNEVLSF